VVQPPAIAARTTATMTPVKRTLLSLSHIFARIPWKQDHYFFVVMTAVATVIVPSLIQMV
jgi:hypothetical protein